VKDKKIVVGITGGIAAYKVASVVSALHKQGADVQVIMTKAATEFITPLTMQVLSKKHVYTDTFDSHNAENVAHINIAQSADLVVVAPATANIIAKMAYGIADDILSTTLLAVKVPILVFPSMNEDMYNHPTVTHNLQILADRGVQIIEPAYGYLAEGYSGKGRLPQPDEIVSVIEKYCARASDYQDKKILITAGATREAIDPVRFITNHSTGKMGYALAEEAAKRGASVTLVSGKTDLALPKGVELVTAETADKMYEAVMERLSDMDIIIKAAAVADYRPQQIADEKIKKGEGELLLTLERTKDIAAEIGQRKRADQILIGFSAETSNLIENAKRKLANKNMDMIIANNILQAGAGFGGDTNIITIITRAGEEINIPLMSKRELAKIILDEVRERLLGEEK
jgi:phosphopantothenoylcysteine decarboxylase/phosphopantothenate--cysteine ligase